jgi:hypothetical protein
MRKALAKREQGRFDGNLFYQFSRQQNFVPLSKPKIISPDIAERPRMSWDATGRYVFSGGAAGGVAIAPRDGCAPMFLLGVLNSRWAEKLIRTRGTPFRGGYMNCEIRFLRDIPIAEPGSAASRSACTRIAELAEAVVRTRTVDVDAGGAFTVSVDDAPKRLVVDKYARTAKANGGRFDVPAFMNQIDDALIVYGTASDEAGNRDAAKVLQDRIRVLHFNVEVPIVADAAVTDEQLRSHDLLLIGRPSVNMVTRRFRNALPVAFHEQSFDVSGELFAHPKSAVIAAGASPADPRRRLTVFAGLSASSTYRSVSEIGFDDFGAEVKVLPFGGRPRKQVVPPPELIHDFVETGRVSRAGSD